MDEVFQAHSSSPITRVLLFWGRRGGGPLFAAGVAHDLLEQSEPSDRLICALTQENDALEFFPANVEFRFVQGLAQFAGVWGIFGIVREIFRFRRVFRQLLDDVCCDEIVVPMIFFALPFVLDIATKRGIRITYFVHEVLHHPGDKGSRVLIFFQRFILKKSNKIIFLSQFTQQKHLQLSVQKHTRSHSAEPNIDVYDLDKYHRYIATYVARICAQTKDTNAQKCCNAACAHGIEDVESDCNHGCVKILYIGRVCRYKGLDVLLDALGALASDNTSQARLFRERAFIHILGDGPDVSRLQGRFEALQRCLNIHFRFSWMTHQQVFEALLHHDVIVLPYIEASQSGILSFAKLFGKVVIASDVGALGEQLAGYAYGHVIASHSSAALAETLCGVIGAFDTLKGEGVG